MSQTREDRFSRDVAHLSVYRHCTTSLEPGSLGLSDAPSDCIQEVAGSILGSGHISFGREIPAAESCRAVISLWRMYRHLVLDNLLGRVWT